MLRVSADSSGVRNPSASGSVAGFVSWDRGIRLMPGLMGVGRDSFFLQRTDARPAPHTHGHPGQGGRCIVPDCRAVPGTRRIALSNAALRGRYVTPANRHIALPQTLGLSIRSVPPLFPAEPDPLVSRRTSSSSRTCNRPPCARVCRRPNCRAILPFYRRQT